MLSRDAIISKNPARFSKYIDFKNKALFTNRKRHIYFFDGVEFSEFFAYLFFLELV
jgi:hypothetical protein